MKESDQLFDTQSWMAGTENRTCLNIINVSAFNWLSLLFDCYARCPRYLNAGGRTTDFVVVFWPIRTRPCDQRSNCMTNHSCWWAGWSTAVAHSSGCRSGCRRNCSTWYSRWGQHTDRLASTCRSLLKQSMFNTNYSSGGLSSKFFGCMAVRKLGIHDS